MSADPLPLIPSRSNVFIDANVFIYAILGRSAECSALLGRCSREEVTGISSYTVLLDVIHRLMLADARMSGILSTGNPAKYLAERPNAVAALRNYWTEFRRILDLNLLYLECEIPILEGAQAERERSGLLTNDSTAVSFMKAYGIQLLATNDKGFERVSGIRVFRPTDVT